MSEEGVSFSSNILPTLLSYLSSSHDQYPLFAEVIRCKWTSFRQLSPMRSSAASFSDAVLISSGEYFELFTSFGHKSGLFHLVRDFPRTSGSTTYYP